MKEKLKTAPSLVPSRLNDALGMGVLRGKWALKNWKFHRSAGDRIGNNQFLERTVHQYMIFKVWRHFT